MSLRYEIVDRKHAADWKEIFRVYCDQLILRDPDYCTGGYRARVDPNYIGKEYREDSEQRFV